jgi:NADH-quinone oxidoreductase subunit M
MTDTGMNLWVQIVALPFLGAAFSGVLWRRPPAVKVGALVVAAGELLLLEVGKPGDSVQSFPMLLTTVAAVVTLLGQAPRQKQALSAMVLTLVCLGLGLGALGGEGPMSRLCFAALLAVVGLAILRFGEGPRPAIWGAAAVAGLGILGLSAGVATSGTMAGLFMLVACAVVLPLVPVHGAFMGTIQHLPGTFPAFLVVLLPVLGLKEAVAGLAEMPPAVTQGLVTLALLGAVYGSLTALVEFSVTGVLARSALVHAAIVWWSLATTGAGPQSAGRYLGAAALALSGLLLAVNALRARYGPDALDNLGGLARPMPRFGVALALLIMAAMGLPLFGLFSGFMTMVLSASSAFWWSTVLVLLVWFMASLYYTLLMQRLLFGSARSDLHYWDLGRAEMAALTLVLVLLALSGIVPATLPEIGPGGKMSAQSVLHQEVAP